MHYTSNQRESNMILAVINIDLSTLHVRVKYLTYLMIVSHSACSSVGDLQ